MTAFNSKTGGFHLTTVGRVQTPTLAIVVEREEKIRAFKPHPTGSWKPVRLPGRRLRAGAGSTKVQSPKGARAEHATAFRRLGQGPRRGHQGQCEGGKPARWRKSPKPSTQLRRCCSTSPACSARPTAASASARTTLQLAQALYEKHKVLTYPPATDARALPEDYLGRWATGC